MIYQELRFWENFSYSPDVSDERGKVYSKNLCISIILGQVIKEAIRLQGAVPGLERVTTRPVTLNGHSVAPGTRVFINIWSAHRKTF